MKLLNALLGTSEAVTEVNVIKRGTGTSDAATPSNTNTHWAGAVMTASPPGTTFTAVGATFVVPKPSPPTSGAGTWGGSAWVGIDGYYSNPAALLQAGVSWQVTVSSSGATSYEYLAWYEWAPDGEATYPITVSAGDTINVWCESKTNITGYCTLFDVTTGVEITQDISPSSRIPGPLPGLEGLSVEWIVEDFQDDTGSDIAFANFHSVTFTNTEAIASNNATAAWDPLYPNAGNVVVQVIDQNNAVLTSTTFPGTNEIEVTYV
ncbi:concanavalin A-like lectin/glucanase [Stipitochalara longipes BDJ]|nr:concanavalin A-like lectin/glucanase [Stipitochalara longipes BDJ]